MSKTKKRVVIRACEDCSCVDNGALAVIEAIKVIGADNEVIDAMWKFVTPCQNLISFALIQREAVKTASFL